MLQSPLLSFKSVKSFLYSTFIHSNSTQQTPIVQQSDRKYNRFDASFALSDNSLGSNRNQTKETYDLSQVKSVTTIIGMTRHQDRDTTTDDRIYLSHEIRQDRSGRTNML
jgi:hypothetical protein